MAGCTRWLLMALLCSTQGETQTGGPFLMGSNAQSRSYGSHCRALAIHCVLIARLRIAEMRFVKVDALPWQTNSGSHLNGPRVKNWASC